MQIKPSRCELLKFPWRNKQSKVSATLAVVQLVLADYQQTDRSPRVGLQQPVKAFKNQKLHIEILQLLLLGSSKFLTSIVCMVLLRLVSNIDELTSQLWIVAMLDSHENETWQTSGNHVAEQLEISVGIIGQLSDASPRSLP